MSAPADQYENIPNAKTLTPTKKDLTENVDEWLDTILAHNIWARFIGLLRFKIPQSYALPKCRYRNNEKINVMTYTIKKKQQFGFYKVSKATGTESTLGAYAKEGNLPEKSFEDYENEFWQKLGKEGENFSYAQELMPKREDAQFKPALGCVLEHQCMEPPNGFGTPVEGITGFYVYLRRRMAFFPAHTENSDLFSINLLLPEKGPGKTIWYSIPAADYMKFKNLAATHFVKEFSGNDEYLRKKKVMIHPETLQNHGIRYVRTVQEEGEGILTLPGSIHFGFSTGTNCAIAWNLGPKSWVPYGIDARSECERFQYASFDSLELAKLQATLQYGGGGEDELEKTETAWKDAQKEYVFYRNGFDPIYPTHRPRLSEMDRIVPRKYIQLGGHWFCSGESTQSSLRYRCCTCRVTTYLDSKTLKYNDPDPQHDENKDHSFVPDPLIMNLPFNVKLR